MKNKLGWLVLVMWIAIANLEGADVYPVGYTSIPSSSMVDHDFCIESWTYQAQIYWSLGSGGSLYSDFRDNNTANCDYRVELLYMLWNAGWPITNGTCTYEAWSPVTKAIPTATARATKLV